MNYIRLVITNNQEYVDIDKDFLISYFYVNKEKFDFDSGIFYNIKSYGITEMKEEALRTIISNCKQVLQKEDLLDRYEGEVKANEYLISIINYAERALQTSQSLKFIPLPTGNICPVCGFEYLDEKVLDNETWKDFYTYEICPCCDTEFGFDNCNCSYSDLRIKWFKGGAKFNYNNDMPENWNLENQLKNLNILFKNDEDYLQFKNK